MQQIRSEQRSDTNILSLILIVVAVGASGSALAASPEALVEQAVVRSRDEALAAFEAANPPATSVPTPESNTPRENVLVTKSSTHEMLAVIGNSSLSAGDIQLIFNPQQFGGGDLTIGFGRPKATVHEFLREPMDGTPADRWTRSFGYNGFRQKVGEIGSDRRGLFVVNQSAGPQTPAQLATTAAQFTDYALWLIDGNLVVSEVQPIGERVHVFVPHEQAAMKRLHKAWTDANVEADLLTRGMTRTDVYRARNGTDWTPILETKVLKNGNQISTALVKNLEIMDYRVADAVAKTWIAGISRVVSAGDMTAVVDDSTPEEPLVLVTEAKKADAKRRLHYQVKKFGYATFGHPQDTKTSVYRIEKTAPGMALKDHKGGWIVDANHLLHPVAGYQNGPTKATGFTYLTRNPGMQFIKIDPAPMKARLPARANVWLARNRNGESAPK